MIRTLSSVHVRNADLLLSHSFYKLHQLLHSQNVSLHSTPGCILNKGKQSCQTVRDFYVGTKLSLKWTIHPQAPQHLTWWFPRLRTSRSKFKCVNTAINANIWNTRKLKYSKKCLNMCLSCARNSERKRHFHFSLQCQNYILAGLGKSSFLFPHSKLPLQRIESPQTRQVPSNASRLRVLLGNIIIRLTIMPMQKS